jgi:hypothetical protein
MRWSRHAALMGEKGNAYSLVGKLEGKRPLGKPRCRWKGNIKIDLNEIRLEDVDWFHLAKDRVP